MFSSFSFIFSLYVFRQTLYHELKKLISNHIYFITVFDKCLFIFPIEEYRIEMYV